MSNSAHQAWAIEVQGLTKSFGNHRALREIDLRVGKGKFLTVLGPNGAGKTTLIKVLATLSKPSAGSIRVNGLDLKGSPVEIREKIGVVTHQTFLYDDLTAYENLKFYGRMCSVPNMEARIKEVITRVGLESRLHHLVRTLSRGMQQRLSIARAVIHNPTVMLLDEPETGLDQHATTMLEELLGILNTGEQTVVMTTHNLEHGLEMGDHVVILDGGKIVYEESKQLPDAATLRETYYHHTGARR